MKRYVYLLPLALFLALAVALFLQLTRNAQGDDPQALESALLGKPLPALSLPLLEKPQQVIALHKLSERGPLLLNVWATWCPTCHAEHRFLNQLAAEGVRVVGLNYKDDRRKAISWLEELGNPYALSLYDGDGMAGMELGVYGAPETFLIDAEGKVRYRLAGAMTPEVWETQVKALWLQAAARERQQ